MTHSYSRNGNTLTLNIVTGESSVGLVYSLNGRPERWARRLDDKNRALIFGVKEALLKGGKTVQADGFVLDDYDTVKAEYDAEVAALAAAQEAKRAAEIEAIRTGATPITVYYSDGEYLGGYSVCGEEAKLMEEIGAAKYVSGWGYLVDSDLVQALGETFTLSQADAYTRPARDAKAAAAAEAEAARDAKFAEARRTGTPVILREWMSDCHADNISCSCDNNTEYAMPDGTTKIEWQHCY